MAVKHFRKFFPLTSPPAKPSKVPDGKRFPKVVDYEDRKVWVSVVFPDTIELVGVVAPEHAVTPDHSNKPAKTKWAELDNDILSYLDAPAPAELPAGGFVTIGKQNKSKARRSASFSIKYDDGQVLNRAFFTLARREVEGLGRWTARLEFSPAKAGPNGLARIAEGIGEMLLDLPRMLPDMEVARLDAAVDCIGVEPLDLIAHAPKAGKRQAWFGQNGRPATLYIFERKLPPKKPASKMGTRTHGPQRLTLYERRDYLRQLGLEPEFGDAPVTRAEVSKRWKKNRPKLDGLPGLANMLEGRRVAYAAEAVETSRPSEWVKFCLAAFAAGAENAKWQWLTRGGVRYAKAYAACEGDLVSSSWWTTWGEGLALTGLSKWVELASAEK